VNTRMSVQKNVSAQNVANVITVAETLRYIRKVIRGRKRLNVVCVSNDTQHQVDLQCTAEFTVERNNTNVTCVTRRLVSPEV